MAWCVLCFYHSTAKMVMKNMNAVVLFGGLLIFGSLLIYSFASGASLLEPMGRTGDLMIERVVLAVLLVASIGLSYFLGARRAK
jgi:hypothetical protein